MTNEEVRKAFEKLQSDPKAQELIREYEEPADKEGWITLYTEVLQKTGCEVTRGEAASFIEEKETAQKKRTRADAAEILKLDDEALDHVSGGASHKNCSTTFTDKENCWGTDACDIVWNKYDDYECSWLDHCGSNMQQQIDQCGEKMHDPGPVPWW